MLKIKNFIITVVFIFSMQAMQAQSNKTQAVITEVSEDRDSLIEKPKLITLDSLKSSLKRNKTTMRLDSLWIKELTNSFLSEEMFSTIENYNTENPDDIHIPTSVLKERLKKLDEKSPFNIEYNKSLENLINNLLKNRKKSYERLMALSEYYFPLFEEKLAKYQIPMELKYLAIVESALNPRAKSKMGAMGLWQFMYPTGKQFNLHVDSYIDDRNDPIKATEAACQYLSTLYNIFGDWDLVLASYNAGPGNVTKAIRRSNGKTNYWNIRPNLPTETQGYLPAFLATMYIFEYHKEHKIVPKKAPIKYFETDTIFVKREMSFKQLASILDISIEELQFLNPAYKIDIIPFESNKKHALRLPIDKIGIFVNNEDKIYAYIDQEANKKEKPNFNNTNQVASNTTNSTKTSYKVKKGDNLGSIAKKYNVTVAQLKKWNNLKSNNIAVGKTLKINEVKSESSSSSNNEEKQTTNVAGTKYHTVKKGDTLYGIAKKYDGVTIEKLKEWNNIKDADELKPGMKLKITG